MKRDWIICPVCEGEGSHSKNIGVITDAYERGEQFIEDYKAGLYDSRCDMCSGSGKVLKEEYEAEFDAERLRRAEMRHCY